MITVEKLEKGTYFDDAFKISFRYDPTTVAKVKELAERRYLPEDRAWEIPAHELPALIEKVGLSNIKSEEAVVQALNTKEIEDKREATQERLKGIKPVRDFDFKTAPLPHQIEAFNYGMEKNSLLIGDEQGLGKTKESIDICVARKKELIKTLIVCGVNSVKYNWEKEIQIHSNEGCVMVDGKTMDVRVQQLNDWYRGSSYFGVINIESLRNEKIQDALYLGIKDGYIGAIIVDEIHKAKNGGSQQGKVLRFLKAPVKIGLTKPSHIRVEHEKTQRKTYSIMSAGERVMERIWELDIPLQTISDKTGISRSTIYAFLYNGTDLSSMRLARYYAGVRRRAVMECCGTCGNNCYDGGEFVCSCEASDAYGCPTAYNDTCNEWCEKGDN